MARTVEIRGIPHVYELTAPADTNCVLVFVHGWLLSRRYWQPAIEQLASHYQCLAYDLRGFGESQAPANLRGRDRFTSKLNQLEESQAVSQSVLPVATAVASSYTPAAYAEDLIALLRQLNITNAWLIGHSLGGSISLWAADLAPELVKGVICINSGGGIYLKEEFERFRTAGQQLVQLRPRWLSVLPLVDVLMTRLNVARPIARTWGRQRLLDLVNADSEAALGSLLDSTTEVEVHCLPQVLSRLEQPVYFIAGAEDTIMEPQYVRHLASFHSLFEGWGGNVTEIPNCGHLSMIEQPEAVVEQVRSIVTTHHEDNA